MDGKLYIYMYNLLFRIYIYIYINYTLLKLQMLPWQRLFVL